MALKISHSEVRRYINREFRSRCNTRATVEEDAAWCFSAMGGVSLFINDGYGVFSVA